MSTASDQMLVGYKQSHTLSRTHQRAMSAKSSHSVRSVSNELVRKEKRSWKTLAVSAGAVIATLAIVSFYHPWQLLPAKEVGRAEFEMPRAVTVTKPLPASTAKVVLPATFRPWQTATLHARVSGYLTTWHRDLGSSVKAGDLLAEIETPELDQQLAEGEALANEAAAAAVQAQAESNEAEAELKVAEAQLVRVKAEHELAQIQMVRREKLVRSQAVSQDEFDTFQRQVEARAADVSAAQSDVARRRTNLETRAAVIAARQATARSRQANVDRLQEFQRFKKIHAPFDGVITGRTAEVGMLVTAGQEALFVLEDLSRIRVQVNVPQTYAMQTKPGVSAVVALPESNTSVQAQVTRVAESVDAVSRTMLAEIEIENSATRFQPGSYAQVTLDSPPASTAWTIPTNTISMRVDGPHVALVGDDNRIELKRVALGRDLGNRVIVMDGIHGTERLVVNPGDDLVTGAQVEIRSRAELEQRVAQR